MFKSTIFKIIHSLNCRKGHGDKMNKKCIYHSLIKTHYNNLRSLLQNDTFSSVSQEKEMSEYQKHITLIIIISIIIACLTVVISSFFLILYIIKRCKKKKEEEKHKNTGNKIISNSKISKKDAMAIEMSNIDSSGEKYFRKSTPAKGKKSLSFKNTFLSSIKLRSSNKIKINSNSNEEKNNIEIPKNKELSEFTFRSNSDTKDYDLQEILGDLSI